MRKIAGILLCTALVTASLSTTSSAWNGRHHHRGYIVKTLPKNHKVVRVSGKRFFMHGGVYYASHKGRYRVVAAPFGLRVNVLPRGFVHFAVGPVSYYYAAGNYYKPVNNYYVVVEKPDGAPEPLAAETVSTSVEDTSDILFAYPLKGQSKQQIKEDKKDCQTWADEQPGTQETTNHQRAYQTCLKARGYEVG